MSVYRNGDSWSSKKAIVGIGIGRGLRNEAAAGSPKKEIAKL